MTKVKKLLKKAFTLVELVVVVAIIAILSGVSVAAYVGITDRANKAADQDVVAQLNLQLAAQEAIEGKNKTCFDAIADCVSSGLNPEEMRPSTKNSKYVWDQDNDRFAIVNDDLEVIAEDSTLKLTSNKLHRWILSNTYLVNADGNSVYLLGGYNGETISNVTTGLDTGINSGIKEINYVQPKRATEGDIIIRTNTVDSKLTIDASDISVSSANVQHYGICGIVENVKTASTNKYIENGTISQMTLDEGNAEFANGSRVYNLMHTKDKNPQISINSLASVYDLNGERNRWLEEDFNSDISNTYTKEVALKDPCSHELFDTIVDSSGAYELCKACGFSLVNFELPCYFDMIIDRKATAVSNQPTTYYEPVFYKYSTYKRDAGTIENYKYLRAEWLTKQLLAISSSEPADEQRYCSHESFSYSHDNAEPNNYHICKCNECGYQFKDAHSSGNECTICNQVLHEWDENHNCKIHGAEKTYKYSFTDGDFHCEASLCGKSIAVWGINDADKSYLSKDYRLMNIIMSQLNIGLTHLYAMSGLTVQLMDATYLPTYFFEMWGAMYGIEKVILPDTLEDVGSNAFSETKSLKSLVLPSSVKNLNLYSFSWAGMRRTVLSSSIKELPTKVFYDCKYLSEVVLPDGLTKLSAYAFGGDCSSLKTLTIPSSVTSISTVLFENFPLKELKFNGTVEQWNNISFYNYNGGLSSNNFENAPAGFKVQCTNGLVSASLN